MIKGYVGKTQSYTPIEYIESSGTQYIDTGILPYQTELEVQFQYTSLSATTYLSGSYNDNNNRYGLIANRPSNNDICYGDRSNNYYTLGTADTNIHTIVYNNSSNQVIYDNVVKGTISDLTTIATKTLYLFVYNASSGASNFASARIMYCKIKDKTTNTLIRDFIPVLDTNNVACLYDLVDGKFYYNAGTGTFTAGQATGQTVPLTSVARKLLKGYVGVPASYTPVEYIESTGTQYIDTGFLPNSNTSVILEAKIPNSRSGSITRFFESRNETGSMAGSFGIISFNDNNNLLQIRYDASTSLSNAQLSIDVKHKISMLKNELYVDDVLKITAPTSTFQTNYSLLIFGFHSPSVEQNSEGVFALYSFKLYDNGTLIRDYIPAVDQDNVACLYETVEGKFYYNAGTGSFTAGSATGPSVLAGSLARKIIKGYVGVNGVARPIYTPMTPLNYIQANGTQYIETGVHATQNLRSQMKLNMQAVTGDVIYGFSTSGDANDYRLFNYQSYFFLDTPPGSYRIYGGTFSLNTDYNIEVGNRYVKNLDTETNIISGTMYNFSQTSQTMKVFFSGYGNRYSKGKLYYLKIYDGNTLLRDYIPVLDVNGVPCLYDDVSQTLYYNQGTGTFLYG